LLDKFLTKGWYSYPKSTANTHSEEFIMTSNRKRSQLTKIAAFVTLLIVTAAIYYLFFKPEVDSVAQNAPLNSKIVTIQQKIELPSEINAPSGIAYDDEHERS